MIRFALIFALLTLACCKPAEQPTVDAARYRSFWLWAGVKPQPLLKTAKSVYVLEAQIADGPQGPRWVQQRAATPRTAGPEIWLVLRVHTLIWSTAIERQLQARLAAWRSAGNRVVGLQIDFDARTRHLDGYAAFLKRLRAKLPQDTKLGITGLLDWSANGDPDQLAAISGSVDEVVLQAYQGRRTIPGYQGYLAQLKRMNQPFKIGLVQGGEWKEPAALKSNPWFRGYIVFLVNPSP